MTEYGARLKDARKAAKLTQERLSEITGVAQATISGAEREGQGSAYTPVFARACGVSALWLATGEGPRHPDDDPPQFSRRLTPTPIDLENNPDYPTVRRVSVKAQAGICGYAIEDVQDSAPIVFRADWYKSKGFTPSKLMALRVAGESMIPSLRSDDLIVINTEQTAPKDGVAFLVAYYGEVIVKRLIMDEGAWWLTSDNPDQRRYPRKRCDDSTVIIGEVVYKQSEWV